MSLESELTSMISDEGTLTNNKVANFCYEDTALENPQQYARSVADYDFERPNNIPNTSTDVLKVNDTVLQKGYRSQASSITRMVVNHFFGRLSYNVNLTVKTFNRLLVQFKSYLGAPNGVATLDANGRVPASQLPETAMEFKGTWNAVTNTTSTGINLINGQGTKGDLYLCSTEGWFNPVTGQGSATKQDGYTQYFVNDRIVYDGSTWNRLSSGDIQRVNGLAPTDGNVQLTFRLTMAQYNALSSLEKKGKFFIITDVAGEDWYTINDASIGTDTLWSSSKTNTEIQAVNTEVQGVKDLVPSDTTTENQLINNSQLNGALTDVVKVRTINSGYYYNNLYQAIIDIWNTLPVGLSIFHIVGNGSASAGYIVDKMADTFGSIIENSSYSSDFGIRQIKLFAGSWSVITMATR